MPFYDLKCRDCSSEFNVRASIEERTGSKIVCPVCGKTDLETVFKNVNIVKSGKEDSFSCPHASKCGCCRN